MKRRTFLKKVSVSGGAAVLVTSELLSVSGWAELSTGTSSSCHDDTATETRTITMKKTYKQKYNIYSKVGEMNVKYVKSGDPFDATTPQQSPPGQNPPEFPDEVASSNPKCKLKKVSQSSTSVKENEQESGKPSPIEESAPSGWTSSGQQTYLITVTWDQNQYAVYVCSNP